MTLNTCHTYMDTYRIFYMLACLHWDLSLSLSIYIYIYIYIYMNKLQWPLAYVNNLEYLDLD